MPEPPTPAAGAVNAAKGTYSTGLMPLSDLAFAGAPYSAAAVVMPRRGDA